LALDAFSSDSIPVHLLTRQAFDVYLRHLKSSGVLAIHISNHFLDLEPVVTALAQQARLYALLIEREREEEDWWDYGSTWMLLAHNPAALRAIRPFGVAVGNSPSPGPLWTDDFTRLYQILKKPT